MEVFGDNKMFYMRDTWREGTMICDVLPINPSSNGVWPQQKFSDPNINVHFWNYAFPHLQMIFLIISFLWQFLHFFLRRLGMIRFTSHMLTGVLLSKSFLKENSAARRFFSTEDYKEIVFSLTAACSYMMFWFLMGVKMDTGLIRTTGRKAITIGLSSVLLSTLVCSVIFFGNLRDVGTKNSDHTLNSLEYVVIYSIQCLSSFPVVGNLLFELRLQNSELGRLAISSAVISDFSTSILASVLIFMKELKDEQTRLGSVFIGDVIAGNRPLMRAGIVVLFVCIAIYVFRPLMFYTIKQTPSGRPVKAIYLSTIIVMVSGSAILANWCKQSIFMGPFILGLAVPHGPPLGSAIIQKYESAIFGTFLPFFIASSSTEIDISALFGWEGLNGIILIMVTSFVVKFIFTTVPALFYGMPMEDCFALSLIMSFEGIFELGAYALAYQRGSVRPETFTVACLYITLNSAIIPPILRYLYDHSRMYAGYEKRNMQHLKPNSELRILSCIYRTDDISPMINLLEAICPSRESPVATYVLHLMELVGQANPIFISHKLQTRRTEETSYSNNVLVSFEKFRKDFYGSVFVSTYTALSMPDTMHGDICMLALNNTTSLILLPFHQTWSADGSALISNNNMIRNLNKSVLDVAPCSVGVFVYRSSSGRKTINGTVPNLSSYNICMIFLGGKDDREAVTLATRMARDPRINITIVRLITTDEKARENTVWDKMLDDELLRDVKSNTLVDIFYSEKAIEDAAETSSLLRSMVSDFDMFIVGRGNGRTSVFTEGLEEWSEFKELGIIGDLLTSQDFNCQASVLVIQQQQLMI
ncbi:Cation/H(+) antiporter 3 [Arabidopsis thaliana]|uniref:CHX3 n=2 Tax=Arabidopsis TaxID=3701 RepID=A0A178UNU2_ARATH|nr:Cation/H+ exchanger [Arabidopsis thaliana x Arabidopsis arenosa]OAO95706.1 CHX3 [Arabidopsis thaliana]